MIGGGNTRPGRFRSTLAAIAAGAIGLLAGGAACAGEELGHLGTFDRWEKVELELTGPTMRSYGTANPFAIEVDVTFTAPSGRTWTIPGFYDGNGKGSRIGARWKARFSADEDGRWSFATSSAEPLLDGTTGTFDVVPQSPSAPGFYATGRLESVATPENGIRYLKLRDGGYWIKSGCDDPENFLGRLTNYDTPEERVAAIDYLAAHGVNSMYMLTHNVEGDGRDVWPWLGATEADAKSFGGADSRFDILKLAEWEALFEHMNRVGVVPYLILEDDSAWKGYDHDRYYREMVARFGHLPALMFNIGEEANENYSRDDVFDLAARLDAADPYDHPRGIHNVNDPINRYVDTPGLHFTSIQTRADGDSRDHNAITLDWIDACRVRGRRVVTVAFDEPRPLMDRVGWWSAYLGGGTWEVHVDKPYDRPMSTWETSWIEVGGARTFLETLPFHEMDPSNGTVTAGEGFCLAKAGEAYAVYLPSGGTVTLDLVAGNTYDFDWWDPANGVDGAFLAGGTVEGGSRSFTAPGSGDWALRVQRASGSANAAPTAHDSTSSVAPGDSVEITLAYTDPDGPGPYTFAIVEPPTQGTLAGQGAVRTYTADADAVGSDSFRWTVDDGLDVSNVATATIDILDDPGGNVPPTAEDARVETERDTSIDIALAYTDPDGPGPYTFAIVDPPRHGTVVHPDPGSNDVTYVPDPGFVGTDRFSWIVNDGVADSAAATVVVRVRRGPRFRDTFDRSDSATLGNGWTELESLSTTWIENGQLHFDARDDSHRPMATHTFDPVTSGTLTWTFTLDFERTGSEATYAFWMQLGNGASMDDAAPADAGVAINLKWGGPNTGLETHEGLASIVDGAIDQVAVASGAIAVEVVADVDARTYTVRIGADEVVDVPFENDVAIDAVRMFADALNGSNFMSTHVDDVTIYADEPANTGGTDPFKETPTTTEPTVGTGPAVGNSFTD